MKNKLHFKSVSVEDFIDQAQDNDYGNVCTDNSIIDAKDKAEKELKRGIDINTVLDEFSMEIIDIYRKIIISYAENEDVKADVYIIKD